MINVIIEVYMREHFFKFRCTCAERKLIMNIENLLTNGAFYITLLVFVGLVGSWFFRDIGASVDFGFVKTIVRVVMAIAWGIALSWLLFHIGTIPGIVGFIVGFIIGITGLIYTFLLWVLKKIRNLLAKLWKSIPWWGKLILVVVLIILAILVIASVF